MRPHGLAYFRFRLKTKIRAFLIFEAAAFSTIQRTMEKLERLDIVTPTSDARRGRVYCANEVMAILDEPAHLTPMEAV